MTPSQQAELEQVAREWLIESGFCHRNYDGKVTPERTDVETLTTLLAAQRATVLEEVAKRFSCTAGLVQWCKQQAQEQRPWATGA